MFDILIGLGLAFVMLRLAERLTEKHSVPIRIARREAMDQRVSSRGRS